MFHTASLNSSSGSVYVSIDRLDRVRDKEPQNQQGSKVIDDRVGLVSGDRERKRADVYVTIIRINVNVYTYIYTYMYMYVVII